MIEAIIVADSLSEDRHRITTFELTMPKVLLAQFNKHNLIRNSAESSRARPTSAILKQVEEQPYLPETWRYAQRGMQPAESMGVDDWFEMTELESTLRATVLDIVARMQKLNAAKEDINRYLEPWMFAKVVATATTFDNYWKLRLHGDAQGAHRQLAEAMHEAYVTSRPIPRSYVSKRYPIRKRIAMWHLPYVTDEERAQADPALLPLISAARCGRVSYGRPGQTRTLEEDIERGWSFVVQEHWTPLEHPARCDPSGYLDSCWHGAYQGWIPLRKHYAGESGTPGLGCQEDDLDWAIRLHANAEVKIHV